MSTADWRPGGAAADDAASPRDLADLAQAGYVIVRQPLMQVMFEVHHIIDRPGYLVNYLGRPHLRPAPKKFATTEEELGEPEVLADAPVEPSADSDSTRFGFGETLTSGSRGLGLVIVTRAGVGVGSSRQYLRGPQPECDVQDEIPSGSRVFRGIARPNPNFMYETAWRFEALICLDPWESQLRVRHCRVMRDAIHYITGLAATARSPILSLQSPAQIPPEELVTGPRTTTDEENMLTPASSLAVRFTIAIQNPSAKLTAWLATELERYCREHGLGLWLADTRLGSRQGNWCRVCTYKRDVSEHTLATRKNDDHLVQFCMPITLVGPARVGSTQALTRFLSQYGDVGIAACSAVPLDDLLFIHLELSIPEIDRQDLFEIVDESWARTNSALLPSEALARMFERVGHGRRADPAHTKALVDQAGDYRCLIGPPRRVRHGEDDKRMAIWFSWQTHGVEPDLTIPLRGFFEALTDVRLINKEEQDLLLSDSLPNLDYLVCRNMGNSVLRGRGKLAVLRDAALASYPDNALESRPTNLCVSIEEAWRARTMRSGTQALRELTVAWRECWLGHWALPL